MTQTKAYEPNILVDTSDLPRDEWLKYRRLGIGGSDAAAILGISPFRTARDLYYDKLNIQETIKEQTAQYPNLVCYCFDPFSTLVYTV